MQSVMKETVPCPEPSLVFPRREVLSPSSASSWHKALGVCHIWTGELNNTKPEIDLCLCLSQASGSSPDSFTVRGSGPLGILALGLSVTR